MSAAALAGSFSYLCSIAWCPYGVFPETGGGDLIAPTPDGEPVHKLSLHFVAGFTIFSNTWKGRAGGRLQSPQLYVSLPGSFLTHRKVNIA